MILKRIALLTCWYGEYPWYFPYFIHSCRYNLSINFIIITDNLTLVPNKPENIIIIYKTFKDLKSIASEKLGLLVNFEDPYKLCDFKPTYGLIFSELFEGYDFWGYADIDIIYGNIRAFMTDELLSSFELISVRHDYLTGNFALYQNNEKTKTLFQRSKDYKKVLSSYEHYCFDECNFLWNELEEGKNIFDLPCRIESMTHVIKTMETNGQLKVHLDFIIIEGVPGNIVWNEGKVFYKNKYEGMLYHLYLLKKISPNRILNPIPNKFRISSNQIYPY